MSKKGKKRPEKWTFTIYDRRGKKILTTFKSATVPNTYKKHFTIRQGNRWRYYVFMSHKSRLFEKELVYREL